jgi:hypothetical protein
LLGRFSFLIQLFQKLCGCGLRRGSFADARAAGPWMCRAHPAQGYKENKTTLLPAVFGFCTGGPFNCIIRIGNNNFV